MHGPGAEAVAPPEIGFIRFRQAPGHAGKAKGAGAQSTLRACAVPTIPLSNRPRASDRDGTIGILSGEGRREQIGDGMADAVDLEMEEA